MMRMMTLIFNLNDAEPLIHLLLGHPVLSSEEQRCWCYFFPGIYYKWNNSHGKTFILNTHVQLPIITYQAPSPTPFIWTWIVSRHSLIMYLGISDLAHSTISRQQSYFCEAGFSEKLKSANHWLYLMLLILRDKEGRSEIWQLLQIFPLYSHL